MKFFKRLSLILVLISCNIIPDDEEEFYYYEPVIGEAYQVIADLDNMVEFEYQIQKDLLVETEDSRGYKYTLEIPAFAISPGSSNNFRGYIAPLSGIQNLPSDVDFQFGVEVEPFGVTFSKPVKITIDLPGNFDTQNLKGFYNEGDWGMAYLEPIQIKRSSGNVQAIFNVLHFSQYGGINAGNENFDCPDPRSAQTCENVREIIACKLSTYEVGGNEELTQEDKNSINAILRTFMEMQLQYLEEEPPDYLDLFEFQYDLSQYLCWEAMTQEFNSNPESIFGDLYNKAEEYINDVFTEIMTDLEETCIGDRLNYDCTYGTAWNTMLTYIQMLVVAQQLGIDEKIPIPDLFEFCDGAVNELLHNFTMVNRLNMTEFSYPGGPNNYFNYYKNYYIELQDPNDVISIDYFMTNILDSLVKVEDTDIQWIETGSQLTSENAFIYNNGTISLNTIQEYVSQSLNCNWAEEICVEHFYSVFSLYRNDCDVASVTLSWYNQQ